MVISMDLTHFNEQGYARMVDVSVKPDNERLAVAQATVRMRPETLTKVRQGKIGKGDVLGVAQVAGIMGAKRTTALIPMCHPLLLTSIDIKFTLDDRESAVRIECRVKTTGKTGVEMEALTGASTAALTIYDMVKAVDPWMRITDIMLLEKEGGQNGHMLRESP